MKKIICFILFICFFQINAQVKSGLSTYSIKYGEPVLLVIEVTTEREQKVEFPDIKDTLSFHLEVLERKIDSIKQDNQKISIDSITFSGYEKGNFTVPELKISIDTNEYLTPEYIINIDSVVVDTLKQNLYDIKPIIEEPYNFKDYLVKYWFYVIIALVIIIILIVLIMLYLVEKKKNKKVDIEKIDIAILNKIKKLEKSSYLKRGLYKEYFSELDKITREYLSIRWNFPADKLLSRELAEYISKKHYLTDEQVNSLYSFFITADLVKFAKCIPNKQESELYTKQIKKFVEETKLEFYNTRKIDE